MDQIKEKLRTLIGTGEQIQSRILPHNWLKDKKSQINSKYRNLQTSNAITTELVGYGAGEVISSLFGTSRAKAKKLTKVALMNNIKQQKEQEVKNLESQFRTHNLNLEVQYNAWFSEVKNNISQNEFDETLYKLMDTQYESKLESKLKKGLSLLNKLLLDVDLKKNLPPKNKTKVMFDNDVLNKIVEGDIDIESILDTQKFDFYATHIQADQVSRCSDEEKRAKLTLNLTKLAPIILPTESFILGTSRLGEARMGSSETFTTLKKDNPKHTEDALMGEVAIKKGLLFVTNDKQLKSRILMNGGKSIDLEEFKKLM